MLVVEMKQQKSESLIFSIKVLFFRLFCALVAFVFPRSDKLHIINKRRRYEFQYWRLVAGQTCLNIQTCVSVTPVRMVWSDGDSVGRMSGDHLVNISFIASTLVTTHVCYQYGQWSVRVWSCHHICGHTTLVKLHHAHDYFLFCYVSWGTVLTWREPLSSKKCSGSWH